jgi:hypothetical protein
VTLYPRYVDATLPPIRLLAGGGYGISARTPHSTSDRAREGGWAGPDNPRRIRSAATAVSVLEAKRGSQTRGRPQSRSALNRRRYFKYALDARGSRLPSASNRGRNVLVTGIRGAERADRLTSDVRFAKALIELNRWPK